MNITSHVTRRQFLQSAATGTAVAGGAFTGGALGPQSLAAEPVAAGSGSPVLDKSRRVLFFDEGMIESLKNTRFVLNPAVKVADNPVIRGDRPWEESRLAGKLVKLRFHLTDAQLFPFRFAD